MVRNALVAAVLGVVAFVGQAAGDVFLSPAWWGAGDGGTTYQQWDVFTAGTGNLPDIGRLTDGTVLADPTVDALPPAFVTSTGNFYSFSGPYGVATDVPNYGSGAGTHIIVQTAASMNPDAEVGGPASVFIDSLRIEDGSGTVLPGGSNAEALQKALITTTPDSGPMGETTVEWLIWEFYLPGYAGDFEILSESIIHSQYRELRVDTAIAGAAYPITPVPEPTSLLLLGVGAVLLRRRG